MPTYGSIAQTGYRPHLDSQDFRNLVKYGLLVVLALMFIFSVRGVWRGLSVTLETETGWLILISLALPATAVILTIIGGLEILKEDRSRKWLARLSGVVFFLAAMSFAYIGFLSGEEKAHENRLQSHPDVIAKKQEIAEVVKRQQAYGIANAEKMSLLARERELRDDLREIENRLRHELSNSQTRAQKAMGEHLVKVRLLFALVPDLSLWVLSQLVVIVFVGGSAFNSLPASQQFQTAQPEPKPRRERQIVYQPIPTDDERIASVAKNESTPPEHTRNGQRNLPEKVETQNQDIDWGV